MANSGIKGNNLVKYTNMLLLRLFVSAIIGIIMATYEIQVNIIYNLSTNNC